MKLLENKDNVNTPNADFPFGDVRDKATGIAGTKWNKEMMSDIIQFFSKMFNKSGLIANGNFDNETNGFQLFEAYSQTNILKQKIIQLPGLDCTSLGGITQTVAHGLSSSDFGKIKSIDCQILDDAQNEWFPYNINIGTQGCYVTVDATNINLTFTAAANNVFTNGFFWRANICRRFKSKGFCEN